MHYRCLVPIECKYALIDQLFLNVLLDLADSLANYMDFIVRFVEVKLGSVLSIGIVVLLLLIIGLMVILVGRLLLCGGGEWCVLARLGLISLNQ